MGLSANRVFLFLFLTVICTSAQDLFSPDQIQQIDTLVEEVLRCSNLPGVTVSAVRNGMVFAKGYGKRDVENSADVTADSLFCIGSVTKTMTATLLGKLLPEKFAKTLWNTKLKDILGDSFMLNTTQLTEEVTVKDILSHRTGLSKGVYGVFVGYQENVTRANLAEKLRFLPAMKPFRDVYMYNNWMYFLAGYLAEVLSGGTKSWEQLLQDHLFKPLNMTSTAGMTDLGRLARENRLALPYIYQDGQFIRLPYEAFHMRPLEPAGSVYSSANDMAKYMQYLVDPPEDVKANPALAHMQMFLPVQILDSPSGFFRPFFPVSQYMYAYGLGFFTANYRGHVHALHSGDLFSYTSTMWLFGNSKAGVFVSTNGLIQTPNLPKEMIISYVTDLLMGESPWVNASTACSFPAPWYPSGAGAAQPTNDTRPEYPPLRPLSEYVGIYGHPLLGDIHVSINTTGSERLEVKLGTRLQAVLHPTQQKDVFNWEFIGALWTLDIAYPSPDGVRFTEGEEGQLETLVSDAIGKEFVFKRGVRFSDKTSGSNVSRGMIWSYLIVTFLAVFTFAN